MIEINDSKLSNDNIFYEELKLTIGRTEYQGTINFDEEDLYELINLMPKMQSGNEFEMLEALTAFVNMVVELEGVDEIADIRIVQLLGEQIIPLITPSIERYAQEKGNGATPKAGGKRIL